MAGWGVTDESEINKSGRKCEDLILQYYFCPPVMMPSSPCSQIPRPGCLALTVGLWNSAKLEGKIASGRMS